MRHNLSEINNIIKDRRTIYPIQFSERKVHKEIITNLINNAIWAPNHGMTQPWRFQVFQGDALKRLSQFLGDYYESFTPKEKYKEVKHKKILARPLQSSAIIVVGMKRDPKGKIRELEEIGAVACAIQNMYLTAAAYGLGAFWSSPGMMYTEEFANYFGMKSPDRVLGLVYLGYPKAEWPRGQRKPIDQCTKWIDE